MIANREVEFGRKNGKTCFLFNSLALFLLWAICVVLVFISTANWIIRVSVTLISLFPCAWIEERLLSPYINKYAERLLGKNRS